MPHLTVENLRVGYIPGIDILQGLSLEVKPGKITGIIGPNGAGKSTLLKAVFGFLVPHEGTMLFNGTPIQGQSPAEIKKQDETTTTLKAQGTVNGNLAVAGRLVVERFNLADRHPERELTDNYLRIKLQRQYAILWPVELIADAEPEELN